MAEQENYMTIILIDPRTGKPWDENDPIQLSRTEYEFVAEQALKNGLSFEDEFIREVKIGMESLIERRSKKQRFILAETAGRKREYSYLVDEDFPLGVFNDENLPDEILGEIEAVGQSDEAPAFLWAPDGKLEYRVVEEN